MSRPAQGQAIAQKVRQSQVREAMLTGVSARDLATIFSMSQPTLLKRLGTVQPCGERNGAPIYSIAEAAPFLVTPQIDIESLIRKLKAKDLPPALQKAFWDAQAARQNYEEKAGHLWHTHRVQRVIGDLLMLVRQRLVLATDHIDRLAPLTDEQRRLVQGTFDQTLSDLQARIVDAFKDYRPEGDRQELYEQGMPPPPAWPASEEEEEDDEDEAPDEEDDGLGL